MQTFLGILLALAMGATVVSLMAGLASMGKPAKSGKADSNIWMRRRVGFQLLALIILGLLFFLYS